MGSDSPADAEALDRLLETLDDARPVDRATRDELLAFTALARQWSRKTDLVRVRSPEELAELLFLDAALLATAIPEGARVLDVGAGAGAPGLPLAQLRPDLRVTLLEPRRRRVTFMRLATGTLGLGERVRVIEGRLEEPPQPTLVGDHDVAYSRATFAPPEWLRRGLAIAPRVMVLLAREAPPEPTEGATLESTIAYAVPSSGAPRRLVTYATES